MKTTFRSISAALFAALLIALLAACGGGSGTVSDGGAVSDTAQDATDAAETGTTSALSTIKQEDFGGKDFRIISTNQDNRHVDVVAEEENGATLNDLVYRRNRTIEEMFNVKISAKDDSYTNITNLAVTSSQAGDNPYDLYMTNFTGHSAATAGALIAWNTLDSMDISKPWWDQGAINEMALGGNSYLITGDISPTCLLTSECILFNKRLLEGIGMEQPYDEAFGGTWTIDLMTKLTADLTTDLDGDGVLSDKTDLYSFSLWYDGSTALFYGAGGYLCTRDADNMPVLAFSTEKNISVYEKMFKLIVDNRANYSKSDHVQSFNVFKEGRAYFLDITFQKIDTFLRDMNDDFGILPLPKYDEAQENYLTNVSGAGTAIILPKSTPDLNFAGRVIDGMAAASYDTITPVLYDVIAGTKNVRDAESSDMVQLIIRNRVYDPIRMYNIPGGDVAEDLMKQASPDIVSYFAGKEEAAKAQLQKLIEAFLAVQ